MCERDAALLVPGYTGSKEDFLAILDLLADGSRQVVAIDMRGQFETPGADDPDGYSAAALGADIAAIMHATGARHLVGHSYGGLAAARPSWPGPERCEIASFTLMSSGPAALTGPRAKELRAMLAALGAGDRPRMSLRMSPEMSDVTRVRRIRLSCGPGSPSSGGPTWSRRPSRPESPAISSRSWARRMLSNDPYGLILMARHMLTAADRTAELARLRQIPMLVIYGENDNAWSPAAQENMARRLGACRLCIPGAVHSPAVEAPATTAGALTRFWDAPRRSGRTGRRPAASRDA